MTKDININGKNARDEWGVFLTDSSLSELLTPPPMKELPSNESRLEHGKRVITGNQKIKDRTITLSLNFVADTEEEFWAHYISFCRELAKGRIAIVTRYNPDVTYYMDYLDCSQFQQFRRGMAKYSLKLNEPNPNNRPKTIEAW